MELNELLSIIEGVAKRNSISKPYIVGGAPRDQVIGTRGNVTDIKDFDITTGDKGSLMLGRLLGEVLRGSNYNTYDDGHSSLDFMGVHLDFSSNFHAPGIEKELQKAGVKDVDEMKMELYSRDFNFNTLLEDLDFSSIYDLTGEGINDINAKIIRCPIDPNITIGIDPRRILRAIRFAVKYGFKIEDSLRAAMRKHKNKIKELPVKFVQDKISEVVRLDADGGIDYLIEYKILPLVPLSKFVSDILVQKRKILKAI